MNEQRLLLEISDKLDIIISLLDKTDKFKQKIEEMKELIEEEKNKL